MICTDISILKQHDFVEFGLAANYAFVYALKSTPNINWPTTRKTTVATYEYTDDTAILAAHICFLVLF